MNQKNKLLIKDENKLEGKLSLNSSNKFAGCEYLVGSVEVSMHLLLKSKTAPFFVAGLANHLFIFTSFYSQHLTIIMKVNI